MPDDSGEQSDIEAQARSDSEIVEGGEASQLSRPRLVPTPAPSRGKQSYHVTRRSVSMTRHYGPLPPAEYMREIKEVIPDGPERIFAMAEKNAEHRRKMEEKELNSVIEYNRGLLARSNRGLAAGLVVALALGTAAWNLIASGHEVSGSILGSLDVVGLVSVFVIGRSGSGKPPEIVKAPEEDSASGSEQTSPEKQP